MKQLIFILAGTLISISLLAQRKVPVSIKLHDGQVIEAIHFGQLTCSSARYFNNSIHLRGKYLGSHTESKDYSDISKLMFRGFTDGPIASTGNQKGTIVVHKKSGEIFELEEAELVLGCYGSVERYNQIRVQLTNPLTNKAFEKAISMNEIESVIF